MSKWAGRGAVVIAILALVPGIVPGAVSTFGLALSMLAMVVSLFAARKNGHKYAWMTAVIAVVGVLLTNATLLVWDPAPVPLEIRLGGYAVVLFMVVACILVAHRCDARKRGGSPGQKGKPAV